MNSADKLHRAAAQDAGESGEDAQDTDKKGDQKQSTPGKPVIPPHEDTFGAGPSEPPKGPRGW